MSEFEDVVAAGGLPFRTQWQVPVPDPDNAQIARLTAELAQWREVGREVEWEAYSTYGEWACPICAGIKPGSSAAYLNAEFKREREGHSEDCALARLLAKEG